MDNEITMKTYDEFPLATVSIYEGDNEINKREKALEEFKKKYRLKAEEVYETTEFISKDKDLDPTGDEIPYQSEINYAIEAGKKGVFIVIDFN